MRIVKKERGSGFYYYLQHSFRKKGKIFTKEKYLGKVIPKDLEELKTDFLNDLNKSRKKEVVKPRQIAMYLLREELKCSFPFIGEKIGKKDHTMAIHAYKKILSNIKSNLDLEEEIKIIKEKMYTS